MQYRRFGRTNLQISVLTFGAMRIPFGDLSPQERARAEENAFLTMKRALEVGVNHFETARGYGNSEQLIGMWLPHLPVQREELIITTKIAPTPTALSACRARRTSISPRYCACATWRRRSIWWSSASSDTTCSATAGTGFPAYRQTRVPTAETACPGARSG